MKTAKVDVVTFKKEFTSQYGTLYSFEVKFNNGDTLYLSGLLPGVLTNIKPQAPTHTVIVGFVV